MEHLLPVIVIIFFATLVQSIFSFGGALIALPLLSFFMEIKVAVPLMALDLSVLAIIIVIERWKDINFHAVWRLVVSAFIGIPLGIIFLRLADEQILKAVLAVTIIVFTLINLFQIKKQKKVSYRYAFLFGFLAGLFGGAFNITGPPVVMFGTLINMNPVLFRATLHSFFLFTNIFASIAHFVAGNITRKVITYFLFTLPVIALTSVVGGFLHKHIPEAKFSLIVKILMLVLGGNLLISVFL